MKYEFQKIVKKLNKLMVEVNLYKRILNKFKLN